MRRDPRLWRSPASCLLVAALAGFTAAQDRATDGRAAPARSLADLDASFAASARELARRAEVDGHGDLAAMIVGWPLPAMEDRQLAVAIPPALVKPDLVDTDGEEEIWNDFVAARRSHAAGLFEHAVHASRAHDRVPTREEAARAAVDAAPLAQASCEAIRLTWLALRDDPDHERARAAVGQVRRGAMWVSPEAARRLDKGEEYDPAFGWLPKAKLARYRAGERPDRGGWIAAAADEAKPRDVKHGREFATDHWDIVATAGLDEAAAFARRLEETRVVWRQVFGAFAFEPADLEKRLVGRGRVAARTPHAAILCRDRRQYLAEMEPLEPLIGVTNGIYWTPTKTIWAFVAAADGDTPAGVDAVTVHHEATHQLFAEARPEFEKTRGLAGERNGFWAIEAAACYMETITPTPFGWTAGGRDAGRVPAAAERLADGFSVPLAELVALGRKAFQADERLPRLYSQIAGLADFFMNGERGRYREAFVEYLVRVYAGTSDPETLSRLCKRKYADLDDAFRRHLQR